MFTRLDGQIRFLFLHKPVDSMLLLGDEAFLYEVYGTAITENWQVSVAQAIIIVDVSVFIEFVLNELLVYFGIRFVV